MLSGVYETDSSDVDGHEFAYTDVDEVKYVLDEFMVKFIVTHCVEIDTLEIACQLSEEDLET
jgi:hypothetical protein